MLKFNIKNRVEYVGAFITRPDTLFGASFIGLSFDHSMAENLLTQKAVVDFIARCKKINLEQDEMNKIDKQGIDIELIVIHPFDETMELPIYIINFVLNEYTTGAIFSSPAHNSREHELAVKYFLALRTVVDSENAGCNINYANYEKDCIIVNSRFPDGLSIIETKKLAVERLGILERGARKTNYPLKGWDTSRQYYCGYPIPLPTVYCKNCEVIPTPIQDIPIQSPYDLKFERRGNPLDLHPLWKKVICLNCSQPAERGTDASFESSWYFSRFCSAYIDQITDPKSYKYCLPVGQYISGIRAHSSTFIHYMLGSSLEL